MASTSALSANHSKIDNITTKPANTTAMAGTLPSRISKNSVIDKKATAKQNQARFSRFESIFGPSKTGTENIHGATKTDSTNSNQTMDSTTSKRPTALELAKYVLKVAEEGRLKENLSRFNLQQGNLDIPPQAIVKLSKATTQAFDIIADFNLNANVKHPSRAASLFLKLLHPDIRYQIYDHLAGSELEIIINPTKKYHSPISALKATCTTTRDEINKWAKRKDITLTANPTFGLLNLSLTTFRFSWSRISWCSSRCGYIPDDNLRQIEKYQRCYSPRAAEEYLPHLELWQRATTLAKTSNAGAINHEICTNEKLANVGPAINRDRRDPHSIRFLMLNNHDNSSSPKKFDFQAKDYIVFNPNQIKSDMTVPDANIWTYSQAPYVWSKDWDNHIEAQEYCFVHPHYLPDKWVRGTEACGTETIRNGWRWNETFVPVYFPPQDDTEDEITDTDDSDFEKYKKAVHMRGGELIKLDDEDDTMDLVSELDEADPDLDMDHEEDEDMDIDDLNDTDNTQDDSMDTDPNPPTRQLQLQAIADTIREAIARRAVIDPYR